MSPTVRLLGYQKNAALRGYDKHYILCDFFFFSDGGLGDFEGEIERRLA